MTEGVTFFIVAALAAALAAVHVFAGKLRFLNVIPRSRWLSFGSGISVSYVFVDILPSLAYWTERVLQSPFSRILSLEALIYLVALLGLVIFYGLERAVTRSRHRRQKAGKGESPEVPIFWLHLGSFALYNILIGYLLLQEDRGRQELFFFAFAIAVHFVVNDYGLRQDYRTAYERLGRWILSGGVLLGVGIAMIVEVHEEGIALLFAFLAGGIVLNVLKEELPEERDSRFWPFAIGAAAYAGLLLQAR